jgi:HlyD family secretion protein
LLRILVIVVLLLTAALGFTLWSRNASDPEVTYMTAPAERGRLQRFISATGKVHAVATVSVGSQVSGRIQEVLVDFNDEVERDQPIARLDAHLFEARRDGAQAALVRAQANVEIREAGVARARGALGYEEAQIAVLSARVARAEAAHEEAESALSRNKTLMQRGVVSDEDLDQVRSAFSRALADLQAAQAELAAQQQRISTAQAELQQAQAELANAQAMVPQEQAALELASAELEQTIIRSPIDGVVLERLIEPGQTVAASLEAPKLFTIARDLSRMEVHTSVNEADIGEVAVGQQARFTVDAYPDRQFGGVVTGIRISPESEANVVTYKTLLAADNPDRLLLPGMTASVRIRVMESPEVLKVPLAALRYAPTAGGTAHTGDAAANNAPAAADQGAVWTLGSDGEPTPVSVRLGQRDLDSAAVDDGPLTPGQAVIVNEVAVRSPKRFLGLRLGF